MTNKSEIFVFGSNLAGRHGAGSARHALKHHGAVYGVGVGLVGSSYAIPTKDVNLRILTLSEIAKYVKDFIAFASRSPDLTFNVVDIGCGLAGYSPKDIAPLFAGSPANVRFVGKLADYVDPS